MFSLKSIKICFQCQQSGEFTKIPVCTAISCGEAPLVSHSSIEYTNEYGDFTFMTRAKYICNEGFYLEGDEVLTCLSNGKYGKIKTGL